MYLDSFDGGMAAPVRGFPFVPFQLSAAGDRSSGEERTNVEPKAGSPEPGSGRAQPRRRTRQYVLAGVAIVVVMLVAAYVLTGGFHGSTSSSGSTGVVLVPDGTSYSMIIGQFNGINFAVNSTSVIDGLINSSRGIQVYIMTPAQFAALVHNLTVSGYVWTSGVVADQTVYDLRINVSPGQWVLSFVNPNLNFPTGVTFYSDLTLKPA